MSARIAEIASPRGTDGAFATHVTVCNVHPPIVHLRFGLGAEPRANVILPAPKPRQRAKPSFRAWLAALWGGR